MTSGFGPTARTRLNVSVNGGVTSPSRWSDLRTQDRSRRVVPRLRMHLPERDPEVLRVAS
jgi:hypothetical protein